MKEYFSRKMGNVPVHINNFTINAWVLEKKLLIWRTLAMSACIIGTVVYLRPLEPYLEVPIFGVLVPTFITGYMLVHSSDIVLLVMDKDYIYLETWLTVIGAIGSLICGIYQFYKWVEWMINPSPNPDGDYDIPELVLALALIFHFTCLCAVIVYRILEIYPIRVNRREP